MSAARFCGSHNRIHTRRFPICIVNNPHLISMEPARKLAKPDCLQGRLPYISSSALSSVLKLVKCEEIPEATSARSLRRARDNTVDTNTPYGKLHQKVTIKDAELEVQAPLPMLHHLCETSACFSKLMQALPQCSPTSPLQLVIYADEVLPGNPLAVTQERKLWCFYWTILEFGSAVLSDEDT